MFEQKWSIIFTYARRKFQNLAMSWLLVIEKYIAFDLARFDHHISDWCNVCRQLLCYLFTNKDVLLQAQLSLCFCPIFEDSDISILSVEQMKRQWYFLRQHKVKQHKQRLVWSRPMKKQLAQKLCRIFYFVLRVGEDVKRVGKMCREWMKMCEEWEEDVWRCWESAGKCV